MIHTDLGRVRISRLHRIAGIVGLIALTFMGRMAEGQTPCPAQGAPLEENFNTTDSLPHCWRRFDNIDLAAWKAHVVATPTHEGTGALLMTSGSDNDVAHFSMVQAPLMTQPVGGLKMKVWLRANQAGTVVKVGTIDEAYADNIFMLLSHFEAVQTLTVGVADTWAQYEIDFGGYSGTGRRMVFLMSQQDQNGATGRMLYIDDLMAERCWVEGVAVSRRADDEMTVSWTQVGGGTADVTATPQGGGASVTLNGQSSPCRLTGLQPGTEYTLTLTPRCVGETTPGRQVSHTASTLPGPHNGLVYCEGFETTSMPTGWYGSTGSATDASQRQGGARSLNLASAGAYAVLPRQALTNGTVVPLNNLMMTLSIRAAASGAQVQVCVCDYPEVPSEFTPIAVLTPSTAGSWQQFTQVLSSYSGSARYIVLRAVGGGVHIDELRVGRCLLTGVRLAGYTATTATIEWDVAPSDGDVTITPIAGGGSPVTVTPAQCTTVGGKRRYTLTGLAAGSSHTYAVHGACGDERGDCAATVTLTTFADDYTLPLCYNFDASATLPTDWQTVVSYGGMPAIVSDHVHSGSRALRLRSAGTSRAMVALPPLRGDLPTQDVVISFAAYTTSPSQVQVGVIGDVSNPGSLSSTVGVSITSGEWRRYALTIHNYSPANGRIAMQRNMMSGDVWIDDVMVNTCGTSDVRAFDLRSDGATISWTTTGGGTTDLVLRKSGSSQAITRSGATSPQVVNNLENGATYNYYLVSQCGGQSGCEIYGGTFTTTSGALRADYCMAAAFTVNAGTTWSLPYLEETSYDGLILSFEMRGSGSVAVGLLEHAGDATLAATVATESATAGWQRYSVPLNGQSILLRYIALRNNGSTSLEVRNVRLSRGSVVNVRVSNVTSTTATFTWSTEGAVDSVRIMVGNRRVTLRGQSSYTFTGLTAGTTFSYIVTAINNSSEQSCSVDDGTLTTFTRDYSLPYCEDFEVEDATLPDDWHAAATYAGNPTITTGIHHSGSRSLQMGGISGSPAVAVLPPIVVPSATNVTVSLSAQAPSGASFEVGILTDAADASTFTPRGSITATSGWRRQAVVLTGYTSAAGRIALRNSGGNLYVDDLQVGACGVSNDAVGEVNSGGATITWDGGSADLQLRSGSTTVQTHSGASSPKTVSGLTAGAAYDYYFRCGGSGGCWVYGGSFTTLNDRFTADYCHAGEFTLSNTTPWTLPYLEETNYTGLLLSFEISGSGEIQAGLMTSSGDASTFSTIGGPYAASGTTWTQHSIALTGHEAQGHYIALRRVSASGGVHVRNLRLSRGSLTGARVASVSATSATFTWNSIGTVDSVRITVDGQSVTVRNNAGENSYTFTGLSLNTTYSFTMTAINRQSALSCAMDNGTFHTYSDDYTLPYCQDFDGGGTLPTDWLAAVSYGGSPATSATRHSGSRSLQLRSQGESRSIAVLPPIQVATAQDITVSFAAYAGTSATAEVGIMSNAGDASTFSVRQSVSVPMGGWARYAVVLTGYRTTDGLIALRCGSNATLNIDDLQVHTCGVSADAVSGVNSSGATISWTGGSSDIQLRNGGNTTNFANASSPKIVGGLAEGTTYQYYFRCGGADGCWVYGGSFTTLTGQFHADYCQPTPFSLTGTTPWTLPYLEEATFAGLMLTFEIRGSGSVTAGLMTNDNDAGSFSSIGGPFVASGDWTRHTVMLTGHEALGHYIALRLAASGTVDVRNLRLGHGNLRDVAVSYTGATAATFTWNSDGTVDSVRISVGGQSVTVRNNPGVNSYTFSGLTAGTEYNYSLTAISIASGASCTMDNGNFRTLNADIGDGWCENFEATNYSTLPIGWTLVGGVGTADLGNAGGSRALRLTSDAATSTTIALPAALNPLTGLHLRLSLSASGANPELSTLVIGFMTDAADASTFTAVASVHPTGIARVVEVDLSSYGGSGRILAMRYVSPGTARTLYIDDMGLAPQQVGDAKADRETTHSVRLRWSGATSVDISYNGITVHASGNETVIDGLEADQAYTFQITPSGSTSQCATVNVPTHTLPSAMKNPMCMDLDDYNSATGLPYGWTRPYGDQPTSETGSALQGSRALHFLTPGGSTSLVVSPWIEDASVNTFYLSFYIKNDDGSRIEIGAMTDPEDESTFVPLHTIATAMGWTRVEIPLSTIPAGARYFAFRHTALGAAPANAFIDHLMMQRCTMSTMTVTNPQSHSLTVVWSGADSVIIDWPGGRARVGQSPYVIEGLNSNTPYLVSVWPICEAGSTFECHKDTATRWTLPEDQLIPVCWDFSDPWWPLNWRAWHDGTVELSSAPPSADQALVLRAPAAGTATAVLPNLNIDTLCNTIDSIYFSLKIAAENRGTLQIGAVTDVADENSFTALKSIDLSGVGSNGLSLFVKSIATADLLHKVAALRLVAPGGNSATVTIDELCIDICLLTEVNFTDTTPTSVTFTWDGYGVQALRIRCNDSIIDASSSPYTVNDLHPNGFYTFKFEAVCLCDSIYKQEDIPAYEDVQLPALPMEIPVCYDADTSAIGWFYAPWRRRGTSSDNYPAVGNAQAYSGSQSIDFSTAANEPLTVGFDPLPDGVNYAVLSFWLYCSAEELAQPGHLEIGLMTDPTDPTTFSPIGNATIEATDRWERFSMAVNNPATRFLGLRFTASGSYHVYIDNVAVNTCGVSEVAFDGSSLDITPYGAPSSYQLTITNLATNATRTISRTATHLPIAGLGMGEDTAYSIAVAATCAGGENGDCAAEVIDILKRLTLPYCETFATDELQPYGWEARHRLSPSGPRVSGHRYHLRNTDVVELPLLPIGLTAGGLHISLTRTAATGDTYNSWIQVGYIDGGGNFVMLTELNSPEENHTFRFTLPACSANRIALRGRSAAGNRDQYITDLQISRYAEPLTVRLPQTGYRQQHIYWDNIDNNAYYQIEWGPQGFTPGQGTVVSSDSCHAVLAPLNPSTRYEYYFIDADGNRFCKPWSFMSMAAPIDLCYCDNNSHTLADAAGHPENQYMMSEVTIPVRDLTLLLKWRTNGTGNLIIGALTDAADLASFTPIAVLPSTVANETHESIVSLSGYLDTGHFIAFRLEGTTGTISQLTLQAAPQPQMRVINSSTIRITTDAANIDYFLRVCAHGAAQSTGVLRRVTSSPYLLTGLNPYTEYDIYVTADGSTTCAQPTTLRTHLDVNLAYCYSGDNSGWYTEGTFRVMPYMLVDNLTSVHLYIKGAGSAVLGVQDTLEDTSAFTPLTTLTLSATETHIDLSDYAALIGTSRYIAFHLSGGASISSVVAQTIANPSFTVINSHTIRATLAAATADYYVEVCAPGQSQGEGRVIHITQPSYDITGLDMYTLYNLYVRATENGLTCAEPTTLRTHLDVDLAYCYDGDLRGWYAEGRYDVMPYMLIDNMTRVHLYIKGAGSITLGAMPALEDTASFVALTTLTLSATATHIDLSGYAATMGSRRYLAFRLNSGTTFSGTVSSIVAQSVATPAFSVVNSHTIRATLPSATADYYLEVCAPGQSQGQGRVIHVTQPSYDITGLDMYTLYDLYVRATEDGTTCAAPTSLRTHLDIELAYCYSGDNSGWYTEGSYRVMPYILIDNMSRVHLYIKGAGSLTIGTQSTLEDTLSFTPLTTLTLSTAETHIYLGDYTALIGTNRYIAYRLGNGAMLSSIVAQAVANPTFTVVNSHTIRATLAGSTADYYVEVCAPGQTQGQGRVIHITQPSYDITGLDMYTLYDLYVRATEDGTTCAAPTSLRTHLDVELTYCYAGDLQGWYAEGRYNVMPYMLVDNMTNVHLYITGSGSITLGAMPALEDTNAFQPLTTLTLSATPTHVSLADYATAMGSRRYIGFRRSGTASFGVTVNSVIAQPFATPHFEAISSHTIRATVAGSTADYYLEVCAAGQPQGQGRVIHVTQSTYDITGLDMYTLYDLYVRTSEDGTTCAAPTSVRTHLDIELPYCYTGDAAGWYSAGHFNVMPYISTSDMAGIYVTFMSRGTTTIGLQNGLYDTTGLVALATYNDATWTQHTLRLQDYAAQIGGRHYIAFRGEMLQHVYLHTCAMPTATLAAFNVVRFDQAYANEDYWISYGGNLVHATTNPFYIRNLAQNTNYNFQIRCDSTETPCMPTGIDILSGVQITIPHCAALGDHSVGSGIPTGNPGWFSLTGNDGSLYSIMPVMDIDRASRLYVKVKYRIAGNGTALHVGVIEDPTDESTFTSLATFSNSLATYSTATLSLASYTGNGLYVAFRATGNAPASVTIDSVELQTVPFANYLLTAHNEILVAAPGMAQPSRPFFIMCGNRLIQADTLPYLITGLDDDTDYSLNLRDTAESASPCNTSTTVRTSHLLPIPLCSLNVSLTEAAPLWRGPELDEPQIATLSMRATMQANAIGTKVVVGTLRVHNTDTAFVAIDTLTASSLTGTYSVDFSRYGSGRFLAFKLVTSGQAQLTNILIDHCLLPTTATLTVTRHNTIRLSGSSQENFQGLRVEYGPHGFERGSGTFFTINQMPVDFTLANNTAYDFYLLCPGSDGTCSAPMQAQTLDAPPALSWCENFTGHNVGNMPHNWRVVLEQNDAQRIAVSNSQYHTASNALSFHSTIGRSNIAILPDFGRDSLRGMALSLWMRAENATARLELGYILDPDDASSFHSLQTLTCDEVGVWQRQLANFNGAPAGAVLAAIRCDGTNNPNAFFIDDIYLAECGASNFRVTQVEANQINFVWKQTGSPDITITMIEENGQRHLINVPQTALNRERSYTIDHLDPLTTYTFIFNSRCDAADGYCTTNFIDTCHVFTPAGGTNCIDPTNLTASYTTCHYGSYGNPFEHTGLIDYGYASARSRHTVHFDHTERDPRTGGQLQTVPNGAVASVRLGNWGVEGSEPGQAESIAYGLYVDTTSFNLLTLRYAAVMQDPMHSTSRQPRFRIELLNENMELLDPVCGRADFIADYQMGWNLSNNQVLWKDWTTVGLDLTPYADQNIYVRLITQDCQEGSHYGYAYFTLECSSKNIVSHRCGVVSDNSFTAPDGFNYRWYTSISDETLSTEQTISVPSDNNLLYLCDASFIDNPSCKFTVKAYAGTRFPLSLFDYNVQLEPCSFEVAFTNRSTISRDRVNPLGTGESVESSRWWLDNGSDTVRTFNTTAHYDTPGTYNITLITGISSDECLDTLTVPITLAFPETGLRISGPTERCQNAPADTLDLYNVVALQSTPQAWTLVDSARDGNYMMKHYRIIVDSASHRPGSYTFTATALDSVGCSVSLSHTLTVNPVYYQHDTRRICSLLLPYDWRDTTIGDVNVHSLDTNHYRIRRPTVAGCDSVMSLTLYLYDNAHFTPRDTLRDDMCDNRGYYFSDSLLTPDRTLTFNQTSTSTIVYTDSLYSSIGCDSLSTVILTVHPTYDFHYHDTVCSNHSYEWGTPRRQLFTPNVTTATLHASDSLQAFVFNVPGYDSPDTAFTDHLATGWRCDSLSTMHLHLLAAFDLHFRDTICDAHLQGNAWAQHSYRFMTGNFDSTGDYSFPGLTRRTSRETRQCDSTRTIHLKVYPTYDQHVYDTIYDGDTYTFETLTFDTTGVYPQMLTAVFGCDSLRTLHLQRNRRTYVDTMICQNSLPMTWRHRRRNVQVSVTFDDSHSSQPEGWQVLKDSIHLVGQAGIDSLVVMTVIARDTSASIDVVQACDSTRWRWDMRDADLHTYNSRYTTDTTYRTSTDQPYVRLRQLQPADMTNLPTFLPPARLAPFTRHLSPYTLLCDSVRHLDLVVNYTQWQTEHIDACDSLLWPTNPLSRTSARWYYRDTVGTAGRIGSFSTRGPVDSLYTAAGCDSVVSLDLAVHYSTFEQTIDTFCWHQDYRWRHFNLGELGEAAQYSTLDTILNDTLRTVWNCDSVLSIKLTQMARPKLTLHDTLDCASQRYTISLETDMPYYQWTANNDAAFLLHETAFTAAPKHTTTYTALVDYHEARLCPLTASLSFNPIVIPTAVIKVNPDILRYNESLYDAYDISEIVPYSIHPEDAPQWTRDWYVNSELYRSHQAHFSDDAQNIEDDSLRLMLRVFNGQCYDTAYHVIPILRVALFIPNVFTPGEQTNNRFTIVSHGIVDAHLRIYNREGLLMWETDDIDNAWDGRRADGRDCEQGNYVYKIVYHAIDHPEVTHTKVGSVLLLR